VRGSELVPSSSGSYVSVFIDVRLIRVLQGLRAPQVQGYYSK
jgi:hypothetical protein